MTAAQPLPSGRKLVSNALVVQLLPTLNTATIGAIETDPNTGEPYRALTLDGTLLGGPSDAVLVSFWRDGVVALMLEAEGQDAQNELIVPVPIDAGLSSGPYKVILRVNGSQAPSSPEVNWP